MEELIKKIEQWGYDKNIHLASPLMQTTKTIEEATELMQGVFRYEESVYSKEYNVNTMPYEEYEKNKEKHINEIKDAIGDIFVTLVMLSIQNKEIKISNVYHMNVYSVIYAMFDLNSKIINMQYGLVDEDHQILNEEIESIISLLIIVAAKYNLRFDDCIEYAYNEIKDRKGEMKNGLWVKE